MEDLAGELFTLCCESESAARPTFTQVPELREFYQAIPREQKQQFFRAMDDYEDKFAKYSSACFDQGVRFAFSLLLRLYPPEDIAE